MALAERIPGFESGNTRRNVVVGLLYLLLLPFVLVLLPVVAALFVGRNMYGWAEALDRLPGIEAAGGAKPAAVAFVYALVLVAIIGTAFGGAGDTADEPDGDLAPDGGTTDATGTETADGDEQASSPTNSPTPAATDSPTASPTATDEPTPADQSFSGTGDQATDRFAVEGGLTIFDLSHAGGDGNFAVWLKNSDGERVELLANDIGQWEGSVILNVPPGEYFLDVSASGEWQATVRQPRPESGASLSKSMQETDSDYVGPIEHSGAVRVTFEGTDDEHYGVWHLDESGQRQELLFNEVGPTGEMSTVFSADGIWFVQVETGGEWTMTVEEA